MCVCVCVVCVQVPPALKTLYSDPMPEACETPPLSESLVCAVEECQWWRGEEERRRRELASLTSSSTSKLLHPSHDIDEVKHCSCILHSMVESVLCCANGVTAASMSDPL